jgi:hypothetical protein
MKTFADAAHRDGIRRRLEAVRIDSPRVWGTMSAHQMICHCIDACRMARGEVALVPVGGFWAHTLVKGIALYAPMAWPRGISTVQELDQVAGAGTAPQEFLADRARLAGLLDTLIACPERRPWPRHPIFGAMSERDWLRWAWLHQDHHLRQFGH